jgi:hypothetical protein
MTWVSVNCLQVAWGTGTTALSNSDTTLEGEVKRDARISDTPGSAKETITGWLSSLDGNGNTIAKVAVFDEESGGDLLGESLLDVSQRFAKTNSIEAMAEFEYNFGVTDNS